MRHYFKCCAFSWIALLFLAGTVRAYAADVPSIREFTTAQNLKLQMQPMLPAFGKPTNAATTRLSFEAYGRAFNIDLRPNYRLVASLLASGQLQYENLNIYAGALPSVPGSWARFSLGADGVRGAVWDGSDLYLVESAAKIRQLLPVAINDKMTVVIRATDLSFAINEPSLGNTGSAAAVSVAADRLLAHVASLPLPTRRISVGLVLEKGPGEGPVTEEFINYSLNDMNLVDGIFASELNIHLSVDQLESYDQQSTPFSGSDIEALLSQLVDYKSASPAFAPLGFAHLMTRRSLSGNTIGIARLASACPPENGVSITQTLYATSWIVSAHEVAHIFGAVHDGEPGVCLTTPKTFIMAAEFNGSEEFSACSLDSMSQFLAQATCLTTLSEGDLELAVEPVPFSLYHKEELRFRYFINNVGAESVFDGETHLQPSTGLQITGFFPSLSAGECLPGLANPACTLGNVYDGQLIPVLVVAMPVAPGPASIVLETSALNDSNEANNSVTLDFDIQAATRIFSHGVASPAAGQGTTAHSMVHVSNIGDFASAASLRMYTDPLHILSTPAAGCASFNSYTIDCVIPTLVPGAELLLPLDQVIGDMQLAPGVQVSVVTWLDTTTELHGSTPLEHAAHVVSVYGTYIDLRGEFVSRPAAVLVGDSTDFTVAVVNEGPDPAFGVKFTVSASSNVETSISAAPSGACNKENVRIVCLFDEIQSGGRAEIGIESTGLVAGAYNMTLTVEAPTGYDFDSSNNSVTTSQRVNAKPVAPASSSGGGALSIWLLLAMAMAGLSPRYRDRGVEPIEAGKGLQDIYIQIPIHGINFTP